MVYQGQLDAFTRIARAMTAASNAEPGTLGYEWFAGADASHFRLVETYADAAAAEAHFAGPVVQEMVPRLTEVCSVNAFEVYGDPGPQVAGAAASLGAAIFHYWLGLDR